MMPQGPQGPNVQHKPQHIKEDGAKQDHYVKLDDLPADSFEGKASKDNQTDRNLKISKITYIKKRVHNERTQQTDHHQCSSCVQYLQQVVCCFIDFIGK